ncbi:xylulokinase [Paenibacillus sp. URB8-2]|uniref:xylulokinase n=1 Tax=Paenibacillus sp. URB8-2 TaxID=2741301 RepID=UPI0015BC8C75|nr:xylulokinase [Paenibacillus sp. URB8-2]BCG58758.1 xylulokinase [Paenibacillus sp. URB8-2]
MSYTLGIDIGTSGAKMVIVDKFGEIVAEAIRAYPIYHIHPGWSEQDPEDWWTAVKDGLQELFQTFDPSQLKGVGVSGQMHGLVALDENGTPLLPAILWNDQRSHEETDYLNNVVGKETLIELTGNIASPGFTAPKILWLKKHLPDIFAKVKSICLPKDYINYKLVGELVTDVSDASGTLFFDVRNRKWSEPMLKILELHPDMLPKVYESYEAAGKVNEAAERETALPVGIPVVAGAGDNAAGAVGIQIAEEGTVMVSLGTSGVVLAPQSTYLPDEFARLHSFCDANGRWHVMGVTLSAGASLKWWVEEIQNGRYDLLLAEAEQIPNGSKGLYFLPYLSGERTPHNDPYARGTFLGLSHQHTRGDMTRAVLEGVSFSLYESIVIAQQLQIPVNSVRAIGGGAQSPLWLQMIADIFGLPVEHWVSSGGPALGVALLALRATEGLAAFKHAPVGMNHIFEPDKTRHKAYQKRFQQYTLLYRSLKDTFSQMYNLEKELGCSHHQS